MVINQRKIHHFTQHNTKSLDKVIEESQLSLNLILNSRKLREFPKLHVDLSDTTYLDLSRNRLTELPKEICDYVSLDRIDAPYNNIKSIPPNIVNLKALTVLNLSCNHMTHIPLHVCNLLNLKVLNLSNNKLVSLPDEIANLRTLIELDVSCNEITYIPPNMGNLPNLRNLNLSRNSLVQIPTEICNLSLVHFNVSNNKLSRLPPDLRYMAGSLVYLNVDCNPLESPPIKFCNQGMVFLKKLLDIEATRRKTRLPSLAQNYLAASNSAFTHPNASQEATSFASSAARNSNKEDQAQAAPFLVVREPAPVTISLTCSQPRHSSTSSISTEDSLNEIDQTSQLLENRGYHFPNQSQSQMRRYDYFSNKKMATDDGKNDDDNNDNNYYMTAINYTNLNSILLQAAQHENRPGNSTLMKKLNELSITTATTTTDASKCRNAVNTNSTTLKMPLNNNTEASSSFLSSEEGNSFFKMPPITTTSSLLHRETNMVVPNLKSINPNTPNGKRPQTDSGYGTDIASISEVMMVGCCDITAISTSSSTELFQNTHHHEEEKSLISNSKFPFNCPNPRGLLNYEKKEEKSVVPELGRYDQLTPKQLLNQTYPPMIIYETDHGHGSLLDNRDGQQQTTDGDKVNMRNKRRISNPEEGGGFQTNGGITTTTFIHQAPLARMESFIDTSANNTTQNLATLKNYKFTESAKHTPAPDFFNQSGSHNHVKVLLGNDNHIQTISKNAPLLRNIPNNTTTYNYDAMVNIDKDINVIREERKNILKIKKLIETKLKITLPNDLGSALSDGVILCHLINSIKPHTINTIHIPTKLMPKLPVAKAKRNIENFLSACSDMGIKEEDVEVAHYHLPLPAVNDILEGRNFNRTVSSLIRKLLETGGGCDYQDQEAVSLSRQHYVNNVESAAIDDGGAKTPTLFSYSSASSSSSASSILNCFQGNVPNQNYSTKQQQLIQESEKVYKDSPTKTGINCYFNVKNVKSLTNSDDGSSHNSFNCVNDDIINSPSRKSTRFQNHQHKLDRLYINRQSIRNGFTIAAAAEQQQDINDGNAKRCYQLNNSNFSSIPSVCFNNNNPSTYSSSNNRLLPNPLYPHPPSSNLVTNGIATDKLKSAKVVVSSLGCSPLSLTTAVGGENSPKMTHSSASSKYIGGSATGVNDKTSLINVDTTTTTLKKKPKFSIPNNGTINQSHTPSQMNFDRYVSANNNSNSAGSTTTTFQQPPISVSIKTTTPMASISKMATTHHTNYYFRNSPLSQQPRYHHHYSSTPPVERNKVAVQKLATNTIITSVTTGDLPAATTQVGVRGK